MGIYSDSGVASLHQGEIEVMLDRQFNTFDRGGVSEGVMDEETTLLQFRLMVEPVTPVSCLPTVSLFCLLSTHSWNRSCSISTSFVGIEWFLLNVLFFQAVNDPSLSLDVIHHSLKLSHPVAGYTGLAASSLNLASVPCDYHILMLRSLDILPYG